MINKLKLIWKNLAAPATPNNGDVERIAALRQAACLLRAEYVEKREQSALKGDDSYSGILSSYRQRVVEAESAHAMALQAWENRASRQKSR